MDGGSGKEGKGAENEDVEDERYIIENGNRFKEQDIIDVKREREGDEVEIEREAIVWVEEERVAGVWERFEGE